MISSDSTSRPCDMDMRWIVAAWKNSPDHGRRYLSRQRMSSAHLTRLEGVSARKAVGDRTDVAAYFAGVADRGGAGNSRSLYALMNVPSDVLGCSRAAASSSASRNRPRSRYIRKSRGIGTPSSPKSLWPLMNFWTAGELGIFCTHLKSEI